MVRWSASFSYFLACLLILFSIHFFIEIIPSSTESSKNIVEGPQRKEIFERWTDCARKQLDKVHTAEEFWVNFVPLIRYCDTTENIDQLNFVPLKNSDEMKYAIMPRKTPTENATFNFITLGIGKDVTAEKAFKEESRLRGYNVKFYGADPVTEQNSELYSEIGEYFPYAIGAKAGVSKASVLINGSYVPEKVDHVELLHFLKNVINVTTIDHLWLDAEGAEFGLFDYFFNDGPLERNGIYFCQMNLEVHFGSIDKKINFMKFAKRLAEERRFVMFKSVYVTHIRLYLFNVGNSKCVEKFL